MKGRVFVMYGLLGKLAEWWTNGEQLLVQRLTQAGYDCGNGPYQWDDRQLAYDFMHNYAGPKGYVGDSLGAGSAAQYPGDISMPVQFSGGFQPSMDDSRTVDGKITVARNVARAHTIYDSVWFDTLGLGQAQYIEASGAKTQVSNTDMRSVHPNDWGAAQDLIFDDIVRYVK